MSDLMGDRYTLASAMGQQRVPGGQAVQQANMGQSNPWWAPFQGPPDDFTARLRPGVPDIDPRMTLPTPATGDMPRDADPGVEQRLGMDGASGRMRTASDTREQFNTELTPEQEQRFQAWLKNRSTALGRDLSLDLDNYDWRGAWRANSPAADNGHGSDRFKKPNHPTFSGDSQYSTPETPGGAWRKLPDGSWTFTPTPYNLQQNDPEKLQQYWDKAEPGNRLVLPEPPQSLGPQEQPTSV